MPLSAPINRDFRSLPTGAIATPSGAALVGTAPTRVTVTGGGTAAEFASTGTASYFRETITADSDFGQFTVDFILAETFTGNKEVFLLAGNGAILTSPLITTSNAAWSRDSAASGSGITGWTPPTLTVGVAYRWQQAVIKGATAATGSMKVRITRLDTGAVVADGLNEGTANVGAVQMNGVIAGIRTTTGNGRVQVLSYRFSNQAFDYLGDIPAATAPDLTQGGATSLAWIGDSTTDRGGLGAAQVKSAILANGQGWISERVQVNGLTSRTINFDNGVHPTAIEQIDVFRNAGYDAGTWAFAVGGNGGGSDLAQQQTWIMDLLNKVATGPLSSYRVIIYGFARLDPANADASRFWQAIQNVTPPAKITLTRVDYNSLIHNGRNETGLWQSTSLTEAHMTSAGYTLRDQLMTPFITAPAGTGVTPPKIRVYNANLSTTVVSPPIVSTSVDDFTLEAGGTATLTGFDTSTTYPVASRKWTLTTPTGTSLSTTGTLNIKGTPSMTDQTVIYVYTATDTQGTTSSSAVTVTISKALQWRKTSTGYEPLVIRTYTKAEIDGLTLGVVTSTVSDTV